MNPKTAQTMCECEKTFENKNGTWQTHDASHKASVCEQC
jgi:hypothetical protein